MTDNFSIKIRNTDKEIINAFEVKKKLKFEYEHHLSAIVNPTPDVTEQDKKKARIITQFIKDNFSKELDL